MRSAMEFASGEALPEKDSIPSIMELSSIPKVSRRGAISALAASLALMSEQARAAETKLPPTDEIPLDRIGRLSEELSQALVDWTGGQFKAVIYPANHLRHPSRLALIDCVVDEGAGL
ncbi:hypothetical protein GTW25_08805 [Aliihoeflea aestuarii]|jgi:TRAP-type mannitol/chloroaromatic compound transport system substrate-binding protein|uniref:hypothetical protein n=1 Tax=Aliihoeflea aestuarii TaxID=453840 RepID=UPI0020924C7C|nr:hypothetical protein [Aliihoeflea aestuarii]MCO6391126.1 hypothetical protein [Aliihoeflea aestuarii]